MENISSLDNEIDTLRSEHLTNGEKPIIACVEGYYGGSVEHEDGEPETVRDFIVRKKDEISRDIAKRDDTERFAKEKGTIEGISYFITPITPDGKSTEGIKMCTGLIGVGKDKILEKNVSFLSHEMPGATLSKIQEQEFTSDMKMRLAELKETSILGSIDVVIMGGRGNTKEEQAYEEVIETLKEIVKSELGFEPVVITGPKIPLAEESVYFDTENRRLYISRPEVGDATSESFNSKDILAQKEKWKQE